MVITGITPAVTEVFSVGLPAAGEKSHHGGAEDQPAEADTRQHDPAQQQGATVTSPIINLKYD